ncbi:MAG TPA: hypothetical protein VGI28_12555, partial [Stellaceae bacterium]
VRITGINHAFNGNSLRLTGKCGFIDDIRPITLGRANRRRAICSNPSKYARIMWRDDGAHTAALPASGDSGGSRAAGGHHGFHCGPTRGDPMKQYSCLPGSLAHHPVSGALISRHAL